STSRSRNESTPWQRPPPAQVARPVPPNAAAGRPGWHSACEGVGHGRDLASEGVAMDRIEPGHLGAPLWRARERAGMARPLGGEVRADVVVVGGGITGLTTGWAVQKQGR